MDNADLIPLSELIEYVRGQLISSAWSGRGSDAQFEVLESEIEVSVVATKNFEGAAGVQFWILRGDAKLKNDSANTQRIKLKLKPVRRDGTPFNVSSTEKKASTEQQLSQETKDSAEQQWHQES